MKILVISDAHANIWALEAVIKAERDYDYLAFAGDMVDYGIAPSPVIQWFQNAPSAFIVQGNHDRYAVQTAKSIASGQASDKQYKWIHYNLERMSREEISYLERLPKSLHFCVDGWSYLLCHQYAEGTYDAIENRSCFQDFWQANTPESLWNASHKRIIFGHSHRQCIHMLGSHMEWINPGSISYRRPDDPEKNAQYMVIIDGNISMRCVAYDRSPMYREALRQAGEGKMLHTEIQDFMFFFGDAKSTREPLGEKRKDSYEIQTALHRP